MRRKGTNEKLARPAATQHRTRIVSVAPPSASISPSSLDAVRLRRKPRPTVAAPHTAVVIVEQLLKARRAK